MDTNRAILRNLMEHGQRDAEGATVGKTIIFARSHAHAVLLQELFEERLREVMVQEQEGPTATLDPMKENGAMGRFLKGLRGELKTHEDNKTKQLQALTSALDANDQNSLINRLVKESQAARNSLLNAINPESPESPMAVIKNTW